MGRGVVNPCRGGATKCVFEPYGEVFSLYQACFDRLDCLRVVWENGRLVRSSVARDAIFRSSRVNCTVHVVLNVVSCHLVFVANVGLILYVRVSATYVTLPLVSPTMVKPLICLVRVSKGFLVQVGSNAGCGPVPNVFTAFRVQVHAYVFHLVRVLVCLCPFHVVHLLFRVFSCHSRPPWVFNCRQVVVLWPISWFVGEHVAQRRSTTAIYAVE